MSLSELAAFQARFPVREVRLNGLIWNMRDSGFPGQTLIMLPGAQGTADLFYKVVPALCRNRVIAITPPAISHPVKLSEQFAILLDALQIDRCHVLGAALFGYVMQVFSLRHSHRIGTLILCNSFCDTLSLQASHPTAEAISELSAEQVLSLRLAAIQALPEPQYSEFKRIAAALIGPCQSAENVHSRFVASLRGQPVARGPLPDGRVAIIDSSDDPFVSEGDRSALRSRYPLSRHFQIKGGGHYPAVLRPEEFVAAVKRCLLEPT
jgi:maspardin